jgi:hypothetical protein
LADFYFADPAFNHGQTDKRLRAYLRICEIENVPESAEALMESIPQNSQSHVSSVVAGQLTEMPLAGINSDWAVALCVLLFVLVVLVIAMWIGWTMTTTAPPAPLEPETLTETKTKQKT